MHKIVEQFKKVNEIQAIIIAICDEKITMIAEKKHQEVQTLIKKEMLALHDLEQALHKLKAIIAETCREYGLPEGKMETLFPHLLSEEKNELMACQRYAISCEKIIKNKLKNIKSQVEAQMALPEILHKTRLQHMQENGVQTTIYNQKY